MNTQGQNPQADRAAQSHTAAVNHAATSAFRQTFGLAITCAGIVTLAAQVMPPLRGLKGCPSGPFETSTLHWAR
ncbi:MAG: hypothetical protein VB143_02110 [Burkholderia sp.]